MQTVNLQQALISRILLIRLDEIGDVVLTTPLIRELRRNFPNSKITILTKPGTADLVRKCPYVDKILTFESSNSHRLKAAIFSLLHLRRRYDLVIVPRWDIDYYHAGTLAKYSGARWRISYSQKVSEIKNRLNSDFDSCFTHLSEAHAKHEVQSNLDLLTFFGCRVKSDRLEHWLTGDDDSIASTLLTSSVPPRIALGVGAGNAKRIWPVENFIELARRLQDAYGANFVVVGGPEDALRGEQLEFSLRDRVINLAGKTTLRQTTAILKRCQLFVGNDAGPLHMAAAINLPVIEISCHPRNGLRSHYNSPDRFGPWKVPSVILQPKSGLDFCTDYCELNKPHCILGIDVNYVKKAVDELLAEIKV